MHDSPAKKPRFGSWKSLAVACSSVAAFLAAVWFLTELPRENALQLKYRELVDDVHSRGAWNKEDFMRIRHELGTNGIPMLISELAIATPKWRELLGRVMPFGRNPKHWWDDPRRRNISAITLLQSSYAPFEIQPYESQVVLLIHSRNTRTADWGMAMLTHVSRNGVRLQRSTLTELARIASQPTHQLRRAAIECLGYGYGSPDLCVPALTSLIGDPDADVRRAAIQAVSFFNHDALSARPAISAATADSDPTVAQAARSALSRINRKP